MAAPGAVGAVLASEIMSPFGSHLPENLNVLIRARNNQGIGAYRLIESLGWSRPTSNDTYGHFEEDWIHETFHVNAGVTTGGAGATMSVVLQAADLDSNLKFYPRVGHMVLFPNEVVAHITSITGAGTSTVTVVMTPADASEIIPTTTTGQELVIFSEAHAEGTGQPASSVTGVYQYQNEVQILKETFSATGSEMTNANYFTKMSDGKGIVAYYMKGQFDTAYRLDLQIDGMLLFGKRTTTGQVTDTSVSRDVKGSEGMIPFARRLGTTTIYTPGSFSVQKFDSAGNTFDKEFASSMICCLNGRNLNVEISNVLVDYFQNTNINYAREGIKSGLFGGNGALAASVDFQLLQKGEYTYCFKKLPQLTHQKIYGASGYAQAGLGVWFPMSEKKNTKDGSMIPTFGTRYKQLGDYNRKTEVWTNSGAGPNASTFVNATDVHNYNMRAHIGGHFAAGNQWQVIDPGTGA